MWPRSVELTPNFCGVLLEIETSPWRLSEDINVGLTNVKGPFYTSPNWGLVLDEEDSVSVTAGILTMWHIVTLQLVELTR